MSQIGWERAAFGAEAWLASRIAWSGSCDADERARRERFVAARAASALLALAALPLLLLVRGIPSTLELAALAALMAPLGGIAWLARGGSLGGAQGIASAGLAAFLVVFCMAAGGEQGLAMLLLVAVPLEAAFAGTRGALLAGLAAMALALLCVAAVPVALATQAQADASAPAVAVALILAFGHAVAAAAGDLRLKALTRRARAAGQDREGAMIEVLDDLVTWHDVHASVLRASPAATRLLRLRPSSLQGQGFFARVHVADRPAYLKAIADAAHRDEPTSACIRFAIGEAAAGPRGGPAYLRLELRAYRLKRNDGPSVVAISRKAPVEMLSECTGGAVIPIPLRSRLRPLAEAPFSPQRAGAA